MKYNTAILDLDGTLLDTLEDLTAAVNYTMNQYHFPERTLNEVRGFVGNGVAVLLRRSAPKDTPEELFDEMLTCFRSFYVEHMYDHTAPYDGVLPMLAALQAAGIRTAIVSNKLDEATKELNRRFFLPYNELAIGTPAEYKKPHPYSVFDAICKLGSTPEHSIYVGDSEVDIETARAAGIPCIGVSWGFRTKEFLYERGADYVIDTPAELLPLLKEIE